VTVADFVVREMVRYAESKVLFRFLVVGDGVVVGGGKGLLLQLLSWDTTLGRLETTATTTDDDDETCLVWATMAKIVFEQLEKDDVLRLARGADDGDGGTLSVTNMTFDFCCPSPLRDTSRTTNDDKTTAADERASSAVRMVLPEDEWMELRRQLQEGTMYFSEAVTNATLAMTLGRGYMEL